MALTLTTPQLRLLDQTIKTYLDDLRRADDVHPLVTLRALTMAEFRTVITPYVVDIRAKAAAAQVALPGARTQQDIEITQVISAADDLLTIL